MALPSPARRRSRPVADAPALDGDEVAKAWLVELVDRAPLEAAARLPGPRFADDAPRLCAAVAAALSSDDALGELEPGGPLAPLAAGSAQLAAAPEPAAAVSALEALRAATWAALLAALERPVPAQVAELAERLSAVLATLTAAAIEASGHPPGPVRPGDRGPLAAVLRREEPDAGAQEPGPAEPASEAAPSPAPEDEAPPPAPAGDALAQIEATLREAAEAPDPLGEAVARLRALAGTVGLDPPPDPFEAAATRLREAAPPLDEPRIHRTPKVEDATGFAAARVAPWTAAIERRLSRHRADGLPFAVLCIEVADLDRLAAAGDPDADAVLGDVEAAVLAQLRPADALVRERPGRLWLTTPDTDAAEARALAHRIAGAVALLPPYRGAPPQVSVGVTTCPADATDAATLEGLAEEGVFSARASGVRVAGPAR